MDIAADSDLGKALAEDRFRVSIFGSAQTRKEDPLYKDIYELGRRIGELGFDIVTGGVGTCLEFFYSWQLTQVQHICNIPIILYGDMWAGLLSWLKEYPLQRELIGKHDMDNLILATNQDLVIRKIRQLNKIYLKEGDNFCLNFKKYKID